ncbi:MAG: hypothetical protein M0037_10720 [Betaproteobacteria bacterium]|nr:hypothetical protein [Betaproteobacteria bacterium]
MGLGALLTMPAAHFDFAPRRRPGGFLGWLLLALGIGGVILASLRWQELVRAREALNWHLMNLPPPVAAEAPPSPGTSAGEMSLQYVRERLQASWQPVFAALEASGSNNVALIEVQATGRSGRIEIHARAKNLADALEFVARLQRQSAFKDVLMTENKRSSGEGQDLDFQVHGSIVP